MSGDRFHSPRFSRFRDALLPIVLLAAAVVVAVLYLRADTKDTPPLSGFFGEVTVVVSDPRVAVELQAAVAPPMASDNFCRTSALALSVVTTGITSRLRRVRYAIILTDDARVDTAFATWPRGTRLVSGPVAVGDFIDGEPGEIVSGSVGESSFEPMSTLGYSTGATIHELYGCMLRNITDLSGSYTVYHPPSFGSARVEQLPGVHLADIRLGATAKSQVSFGTKWYAPRKLTVSLRLVRSEISIRQRVARVEPTPESPAYLSWRSGHEIAAGALIEDAGAEAGVRNELFVGGVLVGVLTALFANALFPVLSHWARKLEVRLRMRDHDSEPP